MEEMRKNSAGLFWEDILIQGKGKRIRTATVVSGEHTGAKCILDGNMLLWQSPSGFPGEMLTELLERKDQNGLLELQGDAVFVEQDFREKSLVVCGGGHVAQAVIRGAKRLGFMVTAMDDRLYFAEEAKKAGADQVICDEFPAGLERIGEMEIASGESSEEDPRNRMPGDGFFYVIVTRGHRFDLDCLRKILRRPFSYLGMMGSRGRVEGIRKQLLAEGFEPELLERLHAPIGLAIGAETPEEIGISILAEIIQVKNREMSWGGYDRELLAAVKSCRQQGLEAVMATIIARNGSVPREVGTKMVIDRAGGLTGTIGGGCMEARVIQAARELLSDPQCRGRSITVALTSPEAGEDGMVCGGRMKIFLEKVRDC